MLRYETRLTQYQLSWMKEHPELGNVAEQIRTAINNYIFKKKLEIVESEAIKSPSKTYAQPNT